MVSFRRAKTAVEADTAEPLVVVLPAQFLTDLAAILDRLVKAEEMRAAAAAKRYSNWSMQGQVQGGSGGYSNVQWYPPSYPEEFQR